MSISIQASTEVISIRSLSLLSSLIIPALLFSRRLEPRGRLYLSHWDMLNAIVRCTLLPSNPENVVTQRRKLEELWEQDTEKTEKFRKDGQGNHALAVLSVRTGFDLYLKFLNLAPGTEVVLSAITIPDMVRIIQEHNLVPVPIDMDMETLEVNIEELRAAVSPRTGLILIAHIFGSKMAHLEEIIEIAHQNGVPIFEDCAEAFVSLDYKGHPESDVSAFSFGTIKTATALGGALFRFKDPKVLSSVRELEAQLPNQGTMSFFKKVAKYFFIKFITHPVLYGLVADVCSLIGVNHDAQITAAIRGFGGPKFFENIRKQPSAALLSFLHHQLITHDPKVVQRRKEIAEEVKNNLPKSMKIPGANAADHSYWLFPLCVNDTEYIIKNSKKNGFDVTSGATQLKVCPPPEGKPEAKQCNEFMNRVVYLPLDKEIWHMDVLKLIKLLHRLEKEKSN